MSSIQEGVHHPRYKEFHEAFVRCLQDFQSAKEWTDLVQRLGKLQAVLAKYQIAAIPARVTFCKRISQCLMINLPAGVHIKALQTLQMALERIGPEQIVKDLPIYFIGIFPLFPFATMQVKPHIIQIYKHHLIPLGPLMQPCLSGLFLSLLPSMEDQSLESFADTIKLLTQIKNNITSEAFYTSIWKTIVHTSSARLAGIKYLANNIPNPLPTGGYLDEILPQRNTLVKEALIVCLSDNNMLVKRETLEFLLTRLPIKSNALDDWTDVVVQLLLLLLLKDVSLNRRVFKWFTASEQDGISLQSKTILVEGLQKLFAVPPDTQERAVNPYRVLEIILNDQPLIGEAIIEPVLVYLFHALHQFKEDFLFSRDLKVSVNRILDRVNAQTIWGVAGKLYSDHVTDVVAIIDCLLDNMTFDEQASVDFLPVFLGEIIDALSVIAAERNFPLLRSSLQLARKVFGKYASVSVTSHPNTEAERGSHESVDDTGIANAILSFRNTFINLCTNVFLSNDGDSNTVENENHSEKNSNLIATIHLLEALIVHLPRTGEQFYATQTDDRELMVILRKCYQHSDPTVATEALQTFIEVLVHPNSILNPSWRETVLAGSACRTEIIQTLWEFLDVRYSFFHYKVIHSFIRMLKKDAGATNECLLQEIIIEEAEKRAIVCQRFTILWRMASMLSVSHLLTESMLAVTRYLKDPHPIVHTASRSWLVDTMERVDLLLDPLLSIILHPQIIRIDNIYQAPYNTNRVKYILDIIKILVESDIQFIERTQQRKLSTTIEQYNKQQEEYIAQSSHPAYLQAVVEPTNYWNLLIITCMRFVQCQAAEGKDQAEFIQNNRLIQSISAGVLYILLNFTNPKSQSTAHFSSRLQNNILFSLYQSVNHSDFVLQVHLIRLLKLAVGWKSPSSENAMHVVKTSESSLFMSTLTSGLLQPNSGEVRFYWLEFILFCLSRNSTGILMPIGPIVNCLSYILMNYKDIYSFQHSKDILNILYALDIIISRHIQTTEATQSSPSSNSLLDDFFDVFSSSKPEEMTLQIHQDVLAKFTEIVNAVCVIWNQNAEGENDLANKFQIQDKIVKMNTEALTLFPNEFLASFFQLYKGTSAPLVQARSCMFQVLYASETMTPTLFFSHVFDTLTFVVRNRDSIGEESMSVIRYTTEYVVGCSCPGDLRNAILSFVKLVKLALRIPRATGLSINILHLLLVYAQKAKILDHEDPKWRRELVVPTNATSELVFFLLNDYIEYLRGKEADIKKKTNMEELALRGLDKLAGILPILIPIFLEDQEKGIVVMPNVLMVIKDRRVEVLQWTNLATSIFSNLIQANYPGKYWKKEALGIFNAPNFFCTDLEGITLWKEIIVSLFYSDASLLDTFLKQFEKTILGGASLFSRKEDIVTSRSFCLKQLGLILLFNEFEKFSSFADAIKKLLLDSLRFTTQEGLSLVEAVFLVLRIMLLRFTEKRFTTFWAAILHSMITALHEGVDLVPNQIVSIVKFIDIAIVSKNESFSLYEWMFVVDTINHKSGFCPHLLRCSQKAQSSGCSDYLELNIVKEPKQPLVIEKSISRKELCSLLDKFSNMAYHNIIQSGPPDWKIVERTILQDLVEFTTSNKSG